MWVKMLEIKNFTFYIIQWISVVFGKENYLVNKELSVSKREVNIEYMLSQFPVKI